MLTRQRSMMPYIDVREMVRIRHELRSLAVRGDSQTAASLLDRMRSLAARDEVEDAAVQVEMQRWRSVFRL